MIERNSQSFSDATVRRFLLGDLGVTKQADFERSLVTDDDLEERVRLAELELADDYAANRLSLEESRLFLERFMVTTARKHQFDVSQALQHAVSASRSVRDPLIQRIVNALDFRRYAWQYAFAILIVFLLVGTAIFVRKERSHREASSGSKSPRYEPRPTATQTPRMMNHPPNVSAPPPHRETAPSLPLHDGLTTSVVLNSRTSLDSSPLISLNGDHLTVELMLDQPVADSYDLSVLTVSGEIVFAVEDLSHPDKEALLFDVPASAVKAGDFQIELSRTNGEVKESAGTYYFRVR